jgi:hypothetical protein
VIVAHALDELVCLPQPFVQLAHEFGRGFSRRRRALLGRFARVEERNEHELSLAVGARRPLREYGDAARRAVEPDWDERGQLASDPEEGIAATGVTEQ